MIYSCINAPQTLVHLNNNYLFYSQIFNLGKTWWESLYVHTASAGEAWLPKAWYCPRASVSKDRTWKLPEMGTVFLLYYPGQVVIELN